MSLRIETSEDANALESLNKFKGEIISIAYSQLSERQKEEKALELLNKFETELLKFLTREDGNYHKMIEEALKYMNDHITNKKNLEIDRLREETKSKMNPEPGVGNAKTPTPRKKRSQRIKGSIEKLKKNLLRLYSNPHVGKY